MPHTHQRRSVKTLAERFPPSEPCGCAVCLAYCVRPGWWTVEEAERAIHAGYASRMMLEISPERTFGVISPAFKGCEGFFALQVRARSGCTFLENHICRLHGTGFQPLECRFCHHDRCGQGEVCHAAVERDWDTPAGQSLVMDWMKLVGLWRLRRLCGITF